jgi:hypothetical protein
LASSRDTSNGPDVWDLVTTMMAFQHINHCRLEFRMRIPNDAKRLEALLELSAWEDNPESGEAKLLASARCLAGYSDRRTVEAAILQHMYALDAQMAEEEFRNAENKKA